MNIQEKIQFVLELTSSIEDTIIEKIPLMPEEWDGIELRQYIADTFALQARSLSLKPDRNRMREYRNVVATRPL